MNSSLEDQLIMALRQITRAIDLRSRGLLQAIGLTAPQLAALKAISTLQPVTIGALAKSIHLSQATLTGIVSRLESRALITRSRSGSDRRATVVELTDDGHCVLKNAPSILQDRFRSELNNLQPWEQSQMLASLQRIASMMDADLLDGTLAVKESDFMDTDSTLVLSESLESNDLKLTAGLASGEQCHNTAAEIDNEKADLAKPYP